MTISQTSSANLELPGWSMKISTWPMLGNFLYINACYCSLEMVLGTGGVQVTSWWFGFGLGVFNSGRSPIPSIMAISSLLTIGFP